MRVDCRAYCIRFWSVRFDNRKEIFMARDTSLSLRNAVIYQIFTRNYKGGTFKAVEADLDRIQSLGTDIIYLLPIQPSGVLHRKGSMGSPYAIQDYRTTDPVQGTMEEFKELSAAIHARGMKLMIDVVYNHTSPDSWLAKNHPEWFFHKADGSLGNRIGDWWDVVDLDYTKKDLWRYQIDTLKLWAEYVDGFRCDVAPMVPLDFWLQARAEVEEIRPGCIWLAESVEPGFIEGNRHAGIETLSDSELYQAFDICYDYDLYDSMKDAMTGKGSLSHYLARMNRQEITYPSNYSKLRCLENHDRSRAAAMLPDEKVLRNWTAWTYFAKGTTMIYAGEEFENTHHPTLFDHDPVSFETGRDLSSLMARLSGIKKDPLFQNTSMHAEAVGLSGDIILAVQEANRTSPSAQAEPPKKAVGIFSTSGRAQVLSVDLPDGTYSNAIDGSAVEVFEKMLTFRGEPIILLL